MLQHMATIWHAYFSSLHVELLTLHLTLHLTLQPLIRNIRKSCHNVCD